MEKVVLSVVGMACSGCSANVERTLQSLNGVSSASVSLASRQASIEYDPELITLEQMKKRISEIGYDLVIEQDRDVEQIERESLGCLIRRCILSWVLSIVCMAVSMRGVFVGDVIACPIALIAMILCGGEFYVSAYKQLRHCSASMDSLVALSTLITFALSTFNTFWGEATWAPLGVESHTYFEACCMIISFVLTGRYLEERAKGSTGRSIRELMGLQPKTARVLQMDGSMEQVPLSTIVKGDKLEVRAGEKIPVDGQVLSAESFMTPDAAYVDESMISGEPTPLAKRRGDRVLAGTIPSQGRLTMVAQQLGSETALGQIIQTVQQAQNSKAPVQRIVDRAARVFVPVVAGLALLTFVLWWAIGGAAALPHAIISAVAVLVIACPCAMGLATPTALMVGMGKAAKEHILIKDAAALETLRKANAIVMDKTGTLTIANQNIDFTQSTDIPLEQRESLKAGAAEAIGELREQGVAIYLMSGDRDDAVQYWAQKAGIEHYYSGVTPSDKENMVRDLQAHGHIVAMIGDGVNDTQALALADVSIAMGMGTDVAMETAQVTLMGEDLYALPRAVRLSRSTVHMIWQNLFWAFVYNLLSIPLAAGVLYLFGIDFQITPMWASALMALSSLSVVLNSLRLRS